MVKEKTVVFGKQAQLLGIISEPNLEARAEGLPGVLLWNAGLLHKVGPFRLFVDVARRLAALGFLVFRFDLSGKGDSETQKEGLPEKERILADIRGAIDFLAKGEALEKFVLIGSCSGADESFHVAVEDKRVDGLVLLDGFGYRTLGYYLHHYGPRLFRLDVWRKFFKRKMDAVFRAGGNNGGGKFERGRIFVREFPPRESIEAQLRQLTARQVHMLFVYSGGVDEYYNYRNQFRDMFWSLRSNGSIQVGYFKEADHTYGLLGVRAELITTICDWMVRNYTASQKSSVPRNIQKSSTGLRVLR